jgi:hypothetical protein
VGGLADCLAPDTAALVQAGLFDNLALKRKRAGDARDEALRQESAARAHRLEAHLRVEAAPDSELAMVVILCSPA